MKRNLLPLHKTGWMYLLLVLWIVLYGLVTQGAFNWLNQFNRERLFQAVPVQPSTSQVVRVSSSLTVAELASLQQLIKRFPKTPVVLLGSPSETFINQLQNWLAVNQHQAKVIVATDMTASIAEMNQTGQSIPIVTASLDWFRYREPETVKWRTSSQLLFAPLMPKAQDGLPLVWREQRKVYLTLPGEILRQTQIAKTGQFSAGWNLMLTFNGRNWPLGMQGDVFSGGEFSLATPLNTYLDELTNLKKGGNAAPSVIFIDDGSLPLANEVIRASERLLEQNYLYQSFASKILQGVLLLIGLVSLWLIRGFRLPMQAIILSGFVIGLWVIQYIGFTQMQWLAVAPVNITVLLSWIVLLAYQKEARLVETFNARHNRLLGEAVSVFYDSQKIERIQPLLTQTFPDMQLADKVFDVALQAEAKNNRPLAKNLLSWIQTSGLKHPASAKRLEELAESQQTAQLDSTMVIEPGQSSSQSISVSFYQVENFGRYKVEGVLGKGAMGIVYQGVDPKINRHVAIKTLQLNDGEDSERLNETKERFFREAETAGNLSHANIVTIYDVGEEGELGYIAMDLLTGAPLSAFVKPQQRLPAPLLYQLMIQITDALDYAHRQNVVHRDIKPGNIIFDDEIQRVTLTDFGIAFVADNSKTRTGTIMGSPYYMSPEQILGKRVDGRSDIFSLGVTFYQLLSGHLPFNGESIASVAYHITNSKQVSVRQWDERLPSSAARITNKAMQKDVSKRYQSMDEFKQALISGLKRDFKKTPIV